MEWGAAGDSSPWWSRWRYRRVDWVRWGPRATRRPARIQEQGATWDDEEEQEDEDDEGAESDATVSRVQPELDGDGLPDVEERETVGTDPLDPDSDANATERNELGNGIVDGREDFDGDALGTLRERDLGTDPLAADTDGDGLADGAEQVLTGTDALAADTDGDGVADGREDPDGDGLTHATGVANGTSPTAADIDGDGRLDGEEVDIEDFRPHQDLSDDDVIHSPDYA